MYNNKYWKPKKQAFPRNLNKEASIEKMVDRRERSIQSFADKKSVSIAISSAFNGAADICTTLLHIGKLEPEKFWDEHEKWYEDYFNRFMEKQEQPTQKQLEPQEPSVSADEPLDINNL